MAKTSKHKKRLNKTKRRGGRYSHTPSKNHSDPATTSLQEVAQAEQLFFALITELRALLLKQDRTQAENERIRAIYRALPVERTRQLIAELQAMVRERER